VESHSVFALAEATKGALGLPTVIIRGKVELGDGRTYDTQERIRF
jgi:hypothetical protein